MVYKFLLPVILGVLMIGFQNCGQKLAFNDIPNGKLVVSNDTTNTTQNVPDSGIPNTPTTPGTQPPDDNPGTTASATPGDGGNSGVPDSGNPSATPTPASTPSASATPCSSSDDSSHGGNGGNGDSGGGSEPGNSGNSGGSNDGGNSSGGDQEHASGNLLPCIYGFHSDSYKVQLEQDDLTTGHSMKTAVCITQNACEGLINNYLNMTGGKFGAKTHDLPANLIQYTRTKHNGVCQGGNPHVIRLTDEQVQGLINKLISK